MRRLEEVDDLIVSISFLFVCFMTYIISIASVFFLPGRRCDDGSREIEHFRPARLFFFLSSFSLMRLQI